MNAAVTASKGLEGLSVYIATKVAVRSFARSWTVELKYRKIRVNAISPGLIDTLRIITGLMQNEEQIKQFRVKWPPPLERTDDVAKVVRIEQFYRWY